MPSAKQHLEQARAFKVALEAQQAIEAQQANSHAVQVLLLHLIGLHLIDVRLAEHEPPIHPRSHDERNTLLRSRPTTFHGVPRRVVHAYLELIDASHETRYECPTIYRLQRLHRDALEAFEELRSELEQTGLTL